MGIESAERPALAPRARLIGLCRSALAGQLTDEAVGQIRSSLTAASRWEGMVLEDLATAAEHLPFKWKRGREVDYAAWSSMEEFLAVLVDFALLSRDDLADDDKARMRAQFDGLPALTRHSVEAWLKGNGVEIPSV